MAIQLQQGVPVFSLPEQLTTGVSFDAAGMTSLAEQIAAALRFKSRVVLHVGLPQVKDVPQAERLAMYLVRVAETVLRRTSVGHVFSEGGATAAALARHMGWSRLAVTAELAPGVVVLSVISGGGQLLTIKPGSYAWPETSRYFAPKSFAS